MMSRLDSLVETEGGHLEGFAGAEGRNPFDPRPGAIRVDHRIIEALRAKGHRFSDQDIYAACDRLRADRAQAIASLRMCVARPAPATKRPGGTAGDLGVQHCASGLLVRVWVNDDPVFVSSVDARPYEWGLICGQHGATTSMWMRYHALGIGQRIYRHADGVLGGMRWPAHSLHGGSPHARAALHCRDPYKWQARDCAVCAAAGVTDWRQTDPAAFPPHQPATQQR